MIVFIVCLCVIIPLLYWYSTRTFNYWADRGVKHDPPVPGFGNNASNFFAKKSMTQVAEDLYWKYPKEKIVGFYRLTQPEILIRDTEVVKRILSTDFAYFYSRSFNGDSDSGENLEPLRRNLLVVEGDMWRLLRQSCTPAFTSGKLKAMFPLVVERAERLQDRALALAERGAPVDARDLMARFSTDFIGACGFGVEADSLNDENCEFRKLGEKIFDIGIRQIVVFLLKGLFPGKFPSLKVFGNVEKDFLHIVKEVQRQRNYKPSSRNDFIDLLMEIKNKGTIECESMERQKPDGTPERATLEFDDMLMAAQVFVFFAAGFETSSSSTSVTLHELAYNPEKQKKAQEDIDRVLAKHDNKLSWDAVKEMQYLECCLKEGMRKLPAVGVLSRSCRRKYTFPDLNVTIDEGTRVSICTQALHNDPLYWDNPQEFRPERFSPEEYNEARTKYAFLPFGAGARACIGEILGHRLVSTEIRSMPGTSAACEESIIEKDQKGAASRVFSALASTDKEFAKSPSERLGMMQSLAGLAAVLSRLSVEPAPTSVRHPVINPKSNIIQSISAGLPLIFKDRKNS